MTGPKHRAEEEPQDAAPPDSGRPRRAPPTIDLDASEISSETRKAEADAAPQETVTQAEEPASRPWNPMPRNLHPSSDSEPPARPASADFTLGDRAGFRRGRRGAGDRRRLDAGLARGSAGRAAAPQVTRPPSMALTARVAGLESRASKPAATDPAAVGARSRRWKNRWRRCAIELAATRAQSEKLAGQIDGIKSAPDDAAAAAVDLSAINARLDQIEQAQRAAEATDDRASQGTSRPMMRRCAASWWPRCSICRCGRAIPSRRRSRRRSRWPRRRGAEAARRFCRRPACRPQPA